jgi:hypothetical protein
MSGSTGSRRHSKSEGGDSPQVDCTASVMNAAPRLQAIDRPNARGDHARILEGEIKRAARSYFSSPR